MVFLDRRGFTAFAGRAKPEDVIDVPQEYHRAMGNLIGQYEGALERFAGDGIRVLFNDPILVPDPVDRALRLPLGYARPDQF